MRFCHRRNGKTASLTLSSADITCQHQSIPKDGVQLRAVLTTECSPVRQRFKQLLRDMQADNRLRAWYTDDLSIGLLYTCFLGDVSPASPAGRTPLQLQVCRIFMHRCFFER